MSDDHNNDDEPSFSDKTSIIPSDTFKMRVAQADQAPPCFVLLVGPASQVGRQWPLQDTDRIIGRAVGSHIFVDDRSVSKSHAKIILNQGEVTLIDLESTNKTVINTEILTPLQPYKLKNNDQVKTGNVIFKFLEKGNIEAVTAQQTFDRSLADALTGIYNKGALNARGPESFKKSQLLGVPMGIVTFDIDFFKKINDNYGHQAGDFVLKELTAVIRDKLIRENDFFARSGGEEFVLLLLGSSEETTTDVAERIRKTIQEHNFSFAGQKIDVTVSAGVSTINDLDANWLDTFERADKALYYSKQNGRNQVTFGAQDKMTPVTGT